MKLAIAFAALLCSSACMTSGPRIVSLTSDPTEALVRIDGFGECTTPCSVEVDKPRRATVAKAGFEAKRIVITPDRKAMHFRLDLVAGTTGVESGTLPEVE